MILGVPQKCQIRSAARVSDWVFAPIAFMVASESWIGGAFRKSQPLLRWPSLALSS
jgi:hypothetical protein